MQRVRTAFVLGAGLGTRLKRLTQRLPKPLIPVLGEPLIAWAFRHLRDQAGIRRFVVNTHWKAECYHATFPDQQWEGIPIAFSHEHPEVLETAGGLSHARPLFEGDETVLVYNGDVLSDLLLAPLLERHFASGHEVTLALRTHGGETRNVLFDAATGHVRDLRSTLHPDETPQHLFTGIYLVNRTFLDRIPPGQKLGVVPIFLDMLRAGIPVGGVEIDSHAWYDLGTREQYLAVHEALLQARGINNWTHPAAVIHADAGAVRNSVIGANAVVGAGAMLDGCVLWPGAEVAPGARLTKCVVMGGEPIVGEWDGTDI
jgi:NDP-sugar pyrophosphorylase family protein